MANMKFEDESDVIILGHQEYNLNRVFRDFELVGFPEIEHFKVQIQN
jgi:hypothetical protein